MRHLISTVSICALFWLAGNRGARAAEPSEYRQTDTNFYLPAAVLKAEPNAVILSPSEYTQKGDSYFVSLKRHKMPAAVYLEQTKDWLEPITPPSMPASLGIAPDVMQIRAPQGDVQVAPPNSTSFAPATEGMPIANGSDVKTGSGGSAVVLFGGVNSVRIAPNSEAMVQQTIAPTLRSTRVDLKSGICFSKVGLRPGEKQDYQVHTPFGVAAARGTDFVCVALPDRTDVWIAAGTVQFTQPNGNVVGTVKAMKNGLRIIRFPLASDAAQANTDTAQTMTTALNFIPTVNNNLKALRDRLAQGVKPTPQEKLWMTYLKTVHALIKLDLVTPPPPPPPPPAPIVPAKPPTTNGASSMPGPEKMRFTSEPAPVAATPNGAPIPMPLMRASLAPREMSLEPLPPEPISKKKLAKKKKYLKAKTVEIASNQAMPVSPAITMPPVTPAPPAPVLTANTPPPSAPTSITTVPLTFASNTPPPEAISPEKAHEMAKAQAAAAKAKKKLAARQKKKPATTAAVAATKKPASATTPKSAVTSSLAKAKPAPKTEVKTETAAVEAKPKPAPKTKAVVAKVKKLEPKPKVATPAPKAEIVAHPVKPAPVVASPPPPTMSAPSEALVIVAEDGSIHFDGQQLSAGRLEHRLSQIAKVAPDCPVIIQGDRSSQPGRMGTVIAMAHEAKLHNISVEPPGGGTPISTASGDTQP